MIDPGDADDGRHVAPALGLLAGEGDRKSVV